jgi:hypothetical protein
MTRICCFIQLLEMEGRRLKAFFNKERYDTPLEWLPEIVVWQLGAAVIRLSRVFYQKRWNRGS